MSTVYLLSASMIQDIYIESTVTRPCAHGCMPWDAISGNAKLPDCMHVALHAKAITLQASWLHRMCTNTSKISCSYLLAACTHIPTDFYSASFARFVTLLYMTWSRSCRGTLLYVLSEALAGLIELNLCVAMGSALVWTRVLAICCITAAT